MTATLRLESLRLRDFRNLSALDFRPCPGLNVIHGDNGQGKTSLLEAIYISATSRSFRTSRTADIIRHGAPTASVVARYLDVDPPGSPPPIPREQAAVLTRGRTSVTINRTPPATLAEFATQSPVTAFHSADLALSAGPATGRRTLLDRLALFTEPTFADHRARYVHALKARQKLLHETPSALREIDAFEHLCAVHGAAVTQARAAAANALERHLATIFQALAAPDLNLTVTYHPAGLPDPAQAEAQLRSGRARDAHRASAAFGPHRDDLDLHLNGHPARLVASQGQHRALTLALKAAENLVVREARGVHPILLLDDISSELDPHRTLALFSYFSQSSAQIFLTTTRPEIIAWSGSAGAPRGDYVLQGGSLLQTPTP